MVFFLDMPMDSDYVYTDGKQYIALVQTVVTRKTIIQVEETGNNVFLSGCEISKITTSTVKTALLLLALHSVFGMS